MEVEALVDRARDNDARAWERILSRFRGLVAAIAYAHGLGTDDASDVVQTTWLRLFESIDRLRDPQRLPGWVATTARRECLRVLRARSRELPAEDVAVDRESHTFPAPDLMLVAAEERAALRSAVQALPKRHHDLIALLLASPDASYAQISHSLNMAVGSIGPTRMRAIERLRMEREVAALAAGTA